jgi:hypothetical protein
VTEIAGDVRVTWTPDPARGWRPFPDSKLTHGPGAQFNPDGAGGGRLAWTAHRRLYRIRKRALRG